MSTPDELLSQVPGHPSTEECPDPECCVCGIRDCPYGEPMHYQHAGCPVCWLITDSKNNPNQGEIADV